MKSNKTLSGTFFPSFEINPFSLIIKPIGSTCNLDCTYCYYLEKENLYQNGKNTKMTDELLEEFIRQYIESQPIPVVSFVWQGGEPCLMGLDFYKKALELQKKYGDGRQIENAFQTNGTLINEDWCRFFHDNNFLVGISIDGTEGLHNHYRVTKGGKSTFDKVLRAIELFNKFNVEYNTLTAVNHHNANYPFEVYRFLKSIGSVFMQFLPVVERVSATQQANGLKLVSNEYPDKALVTPWSVEPLQYGRFMATIFDEWFKCDVGSRFVQLFDTTLANWVGETPGICMFAPACGHAGAIEHNGDVYSCDHFVFKDYRIGNINELNLSELMNSPQQQLFGQNKFSKLPQSCLKCEFLTKCYGECPKKRFLYAKNGEYGLNYLCEGYKMFFSYVTPAMEMMARELKNS